MARLMAGRLGFTWSGEGGSPSDLPVRGNVRSPCPPHPFRLRLALGPMLGVSCLVRLRVTTWAPWCTHGRDSSKPAPSHRRGRILGRIARHRKSPHLRDYKTAALPIELRRRDPEGSSR